MIRRIDRCHISNSGVLLAFDELNELVLTSEDAMQAGSQIALEAANVGETMPTLAAFLNELGEADEQLSDFKGDAGAVFRSIYDVWVVRGDYERGKRRHSVRQVKDWLGKSDQIRSLETKLAGKTWLQYSDAFILLKLFLTRWTYDRERGQYIPYHPGDIDEITKNMLRELSGGAKALLLPERRRKDGDGVEISSTVEKVSSIKVEKTQSTIDTIKKYFSQSDVIITVSRARTVVGSDPPVAMSEFHHLLEELHAIYLRDGRSRMLLWIMDIGLRNDKISARRAIYNVYFLIAQFRSIGLIEREGRHGFYSWLSENVCIIVGSLTHDEIDRIYYDAKLELPKAPSDISWFQSDRLFLESIPRRWLDISGSEAYGPSQKDLWSNPTITAHLKFDDWDLDHLAEVDVRKNLRYLYHGEVSTKASGVEEKEVRCISLPEPGSRWSDAYRIAVQAALGRLERPFDDRIISTEPMDALALLAAQNFATLRLEEFIRLGRTLIEHSSNMSSADNREN